MDNKETEYLEHEKLKKISKESQAIGEFLEWLQSDKKFIFAKYGSVIKNEMCETENYEEFEGEYVKDDMLYSRDINIKALLAEYFKIDLNKIDKEKELMLKEIKKEQ